MIIIDEILMTGKKILHQIGKWLWQSSGKLSEEFGGFTVVIVGYFQQLPSVGETEMYQPYYWTGSLAYDTFQNFGILNKSHHHDGQDDQELSSQ